MSTQTQRITIGALLTVFVVLTIGVLYLQLPSLPNIFPTGTTEPPPILDPVPPSANPPENETDYETITVGSLTLDSTGYLSGMIPHSGPITFHVYLWINITNDGTEDITDFHAIKMSLYYPNSGLFYTFSFSSDSNFTILAGEFLTLNLANKETRLHTSFSIGSSVYARVLVSFNTNQECILTTPLLTGTFAIE